MSPGIVQDSLRELIQINREITSILDLDPLLGKIAETTARLIPYKVFAILLVDEEADDLYYRFAIGYPDDVVARVRIALGQGIVGTAARERRPVVVRDVSRDTRYIHVLAGTRSELAVPLISKDRVLGVLDIESPEIDAFSEDQVQVLDVLASQIAIAIDNATLYESERRNRRLLSLLHDISLEVASSLDVNVLINRIATAVKTAVDYDILSVFLLDEPSGKLRRKMVFRHEAQGHERFEVAPGEGLIGIAAVENHPIRVGDVSRDQRYINVHGETISEMTIPLAVKGQTIGVLDLESRKPDHFTSRDERVLMTLATRIASALLNAELYEQVAANERRFANELEIAREIQLQLLPEMIPSIGPLDIGLSFTPVAHLGGDLYDLLRFDDGRVAFAIGDVSGKGAPAALYAALASGIIRTRATRKYPPGEMLELVNRSLQQRPILSQYIALTYAIFDPAPGQLTLANSGLPYAIRIHEAECSFIDMAGIPLGLFPDSKYQERTIDMAEGDLVVMYTDGIVEMESPSHEEFGLKRLAAVVLGHRESTPDGIIAAIQEALGEHAAGAAAHDDQTILVMKVRPAR
jgi:sigma-B regulation protein RsbU (phosphoserine phosphatase)